MKTDETFKPTKEFAIKLLEVMRPGLSHGVGKPIPGEMCIMACFNYALGRPHRDKGIEDCVGSAVRSFDISLNDCNWSSNQARERGMRREAVAKIGSNQIDQQKFTQLVCIKGVNKILPVMFRLLAERDDCTNKKEMLASALECENATTFEGAREAAKAAYACAASACAYAYAAYAYAYAYAAYASAYAYAYAYAAYASAAYAYAYAYASASAAYAEAYAFFKEKLGEDYFLKLSAENAVEALIELKSPGCEWLYLCEEKDLR